MPATFVADGFSRTARNSCSSRSLPNNCATSFSLLSILPMSESLTQALRQATASTFEKFAMLIAENAPLRAGPQGEPRTTAIVLTGGTNGQFELDVDSSLLPEIAQEMLGVADADYQAEVDVLGELANVICGNLLAELPSEGTTHLSAPSISVALYRGAPVARAAFSVERRSVEARLFLAGATR
jgi:CheY-specific phosphatase CheX